MKNDEIKEVIIALVNMVDILKDQIFQMQEDIEKIYENQVKGENK